MKKTFILIIVIIANTNLFGQGQLLERGGNGILLNSSYSIVEENNGFGISIGYSFKGIIDIGFLLGAGSISGSKAERLNFSEIRYKIFSPMISMNIFKEKLIGKDFWGIDLGLATEMTYFTIDEGRKTYSGIPIISKQRATFIHFGPVLYYTHSDEEYGLSPYMSLLYTFGSSFDTLELSTNYYTIGFGIVGSYMLINNFLITPSFGINMIDMDLTIALGLGLLYKM